METGEGKGFTAKLARVRDGDGGDAGSGDSWRCSATEAKEGEDAEERHRRSVAFGDRKEESTERVQGKGAEIVRITTTEREWRRGNNDGWLATKAEEVKGTERGEGGGREIDEDREGEGGASNGRGRRGRREVGVGGSRSGGKQTAAAWFVEKERRPWVGFGWWKSQRGITAMEKMLVADDGRGKEGRKGKGRRRRCRSGRDRATGWDRREEQGRKRGKQRQRRCWRCLVTEAEEGEDAEKRERAGEVSVAETGGCRHCAPRAVTPAHVAVSATFPFFFITSDATLTFSDSTYQGNEEDKTIILSLQFVSMNFVLSSI